jgi:hypothetical protein
MPEAEIAALRQAGVIGKKNAVPQGTSSSQAL